MLNPHIKSRYKKINKKYVTELRLKIIVKYRTLLELIRTVAKIVISNQHDTFLKYFQVFYIKCIKIGNCWNFVFKMHLLLDL